MPTMRPSASRNGIWSWRPTRRCRSPRLLLDLAHDGLPGLDDGPLVLPGRVGVLLGEEVEVRLAHGLGGVAQAKPAGQGLVDAEEAALDVLEVDRVGEGIHQRVQEVTLLEDLLLGLLALDELADLAADGREHLEQVLIGLLDLAAEGLDDAQDVAADDDREAEGAVQALAGRGPSPREVRVRDDVPDPGRLAARPDAAGQADAGGEGGPPA